MAYTDPTGHSFWDKIKKHLGNIVGGILGGITAIVSGNVWLGLQVYSMWSSAINAAQSGNFGSFAAGFGASVALGAIGRWAAIGMGGAMLESAKSFTGGFAIGAVEFGLSGFGAGFASSYAGGASFSDALKTGARSGAIGAAVGGVIQGSYMAGWQNSLHGASKHDIYRSGIRHLNSLYVNKTDTTVTVGSRPIENEVLGGKMGYRHRFSRGIGDGFEMGPDTSGNIEVNGRAYATTQTYIDSNSSALMTTTVEVNASGFNRAVNYYTAMWAGTPYDGGSYNSNYAVNSVIYGAGGDVPKNLGKTPQFALGGTDW